MSACTVQDVRALNARLLDDYTHQLIAQLRADLRAELQSVFQNFYHGDANTRPKPVIQRGWTGVEETETDIKAKLMSDPPPRHAAENKLDESLTLDPWRAELWTSGDEGECLLVRPLPEPSRNENLKYGPVLYGLMVNQGNYASMGNSTSCFRFVELGWFLTMSAFVILLNTACTYIRMNDPDMRALLYWPDQASLAFYVFELLSRICFYRWRYLRGPKEFVCGNILDVFVVTVGVLEQWVVGFFPHLVHGDVIMILRVLKSLRLLRVLKLSRIFLSSDLSWTDKPAFQSGIGGVIALNALIIGLETDIQWSGWFWIEQGLLFVYVFELAVRMKRVGYEFLSFANSDFVWNFLDLIIVLSSTLDLWVVPTYRALMNFLLALETGGHSRRSRQGQRIGFGQAMMFMRILRLLRILRLAKLVKSIRPLYILVESVGSAVQGVVWVLMLTFTLLYAMAIFATHLIGHGIIFADSVAVEPEWTDPFKSVIDSMFTLFRLMNGLTSSTETEAIDRLIRAAPPVKFAFMFFIVLSSWTLLSILTAVVSDTVIATTTSHEDELKWVHDEQDRREHLKSLRKIFAEVDTNLDGRVQWEELMVFLRTGNNAVKTAKMCRVPTRDVVQVMKVIENNTGALDIEDFIEHLADVGKPVTEKSVMKLEARIKDIQQAIRHLH